MRYITGCTNNGPLTSWHTSPHLIINSLRHVHRMEKDKCFLFICHVISNFGHFLLTIQSISRISQVALKITLQTLKFRIYSVPRMFLQYNFLAKCLQFSWTFQNLNFSQTSTVNYNQNFLIVLQMSDTMEFLQGAWEGTDVMLTSNLRWIDWTGFIILGYFKS